MKKKIRIKLYQIKLIGLNFKFNKTVIGFKSYSRVCRCPSQVYFIKVLQIQVLSIGDNMRNSPIDKLFPDIVNLEETFPGFKRI